MYFLEVWHHGEIVRAVGGGTTLSAAHNLARDYNTRHDLPLKLTWEKDPDKKYVEYADMGGFSFRIRFSE